MSKATPNVNSKVNEEVSKMKAENLKLCEKVDKLQRSHDNQKNLITNLIGKVTKANKDSYTHKVGTYFVQSVLVFPLCSLGGFL